MLLEEEIDRLREQNRIFRSELGLPGAQAKKNSRIGTFQDNISDQDKENGPILESF